MEKNIEQAIFHLVVGYRAVSKIQNQFQNIGFDVCGDSPLTTAHYKISGAILSLFGVYGTESEDAINAEETVMELLDDLSLSEEETVRGVCEILNPIGCCE